MFGFKLEDMSGHRTAPANQVAEAVLCLGAYRCGGRGSGLLLLGTPLVTVAHRHSPPDRILSRSMSNMTRIACFCVMSTVPGRETVGAPAATRA